MRKEIIIGLVAIPAALLVFLFLKFPGGRCRPARAALLPATGQLESWAEFDDGYYRSGRKMRFRDNGDGTVTDLNTGLMWVKSGYAESEVTPAVPYQKDGPWRSYYWNHALIYCDRLETAGYSDWRLPNLKELVSILDLSRMDPCVDEKYFPATRADFYWTSTSFSFQTSQAWYVYFNLGYVNHLNKNNYLYIRPVRDVTTADSDLEQ